MRLRGAGEAGGEDHWRSLSPQPPGIAALRRWRAANKRAAAAVPVTRRQTAGHFTGSASEIEDSLGCQGHPGHLEHLLPLHAARAAEAVAAESRPAQACAVESDAPEQPGGAAERAAVSTDVAIDAWSHALAALAACSRVQAAAARVAAARAAGLPRRAWEDAAHAALRLAGEQQETCESLRCSLAANSASCQPFLPTHSLCQVHQATCLRVVRERSLTFCFAPLLTNARNSITVRRVLSIPCMRAGATSLRLCGARALRPCCTQVTLPSMRYLPCSAHARPRHHAASLPCSYAWRTAPRDARAWARASCKARA